MSILVSALEGMGIEITPLTWFVIVFVSYFIIGFGPSIFDFKANRFRHKDTGRFIKWESALLFGTSTEILILFVEYKTMGFTDIVGAFFALIICIILTITLGISTRK
jgi:hypothetical protein